MKVVDVTAVPGAPAAKLRRSHIGAAGVSGYSKFQTGLGDHNDATYTAVVERCSETGLYVGYVPGSRAPTARAKRSTSLNANLKEVIALILDDGAPAMVGEYVGTQTVVV